MLKNSKGKITLKAIKERLNTTGDKVEQKTLQKYLDADKQRKAKAKETDALLAEVEEAYRQRLDTDPLPEQLVDLHATARYLELLDEQSDLKSKVKEADTALDRLAHDKYSQLSVDEIKVLVVDDKWMTSLAEAVEREVGSVSQTLTGRIRQLAERYEMPLPQITDRVAELSARVDEHLEKMGAVWD